MLATYAASRHRQIVPCCMISSVSHDNVSRLVTDRSMCFATALDKAFENIDCMSAILRCQAKNRFYESTQRLIQPRRVLWLPPVTCTRRHLADRARGFKITLRAVLQQSFGADIACTAYEGSVRLQQTGLSFCRSSNCLLCRAHAISVEAKWLGAPDHTRQGPLF